MMLILSKRPPSKYDHILTNTVCGPKRDIFSLFSAEPSGHEPKAARPNKRCRESFSFYHLNMPPQPLKVPSTPLRSSENDKDKTPVAAGTNQSSSAKLGTLAAKDISSPHELTAFVKFDFSVEKLSDI